MRICTRGLLAGGAWLTLTGATVGDPVANKSAKAHELYQGGEYDKALNLYRDALVDRPEAPELHFNVGDALFKSGDYEKALQEFEQALKIPVDRARAQAHYNIGNTLFQQQDYEKAIEAYKEALQLHATDEDAKVNLELALEQLQQQQDQEDQQDQDEQEEQDQQQQQQQEQEQQEPQDDQQEEQAQSGDEPISPEEAQQLLDALKDREEEAQKRRFRATGKAQGKDW